MSDYPDDFFSAYGIVPNIVFDVGSNNPTDVYKKFKKFDPKTFYSFEADPDVFSLYNTKENIPSNLNFFNYAISDTNDDISFFKSKEMAGKPQNYSGSILEPNRSAIIIRHNLTFFKDPITVKSKRIDTFCEEHNIKSIDFMHIDAQGAEKKVISGFGNIEVKLIFAEICEFDQYNSGHTLQDFMNFMNAQGYTKVRDFRSDYLFLKKGE